MEINNIIENKVIFIILLVAFLGGCQPVMLKYIMKNNIPRKYILLYIALINLTLYSIYYYYNEEKHQKELLENTDTISHFNIFCLMFVYTIICITIPNLLYINAVDHESIIKYNALMYISPIFTLVIAYMIYNENLTCTSVFGAGLIVLGSILIIKE